MLIIKTYVINILQFPMRAFHIPKFYVKKVNSLVYPFIWNSKREKVARDIVNLPYDRGGLNMTDIKTRCKANMIINICNIERKLNQPWAMLYTYWLGISLKHVFPALGKNQYVHMLDIPSGVGIVKYIIQN